MSSRRFIDAGEESYDRFKPIVLSLTVIAVLFISIYVNVVFAIDIVYTHLFYIPIVLASVWYYRKAVFLALFLGGFHIFINYMILGYPNYETFLRAVMFCVIAYIVGTIALTKDELYQKMRNSDESLHKVQDSLEHRIHERTNELIQTNESLRKEIADRKQAEDAFRKSKYILDRAQSIAHIGNWAWDLKKGNFQWSEEIYRMFSISPRDVQPTYDWLLSQVHASDKPLLAQSLDTVLHEARLFNIDLRVLGPEGSVRYVNIVADRIKMDNNGNPSRMYGIVQDITRRKTAEVELAESRARAELYLDLMGHDIRNINQAIMGYIELAQDTLNIPDSDKELLNRPLELVKNSSRLIENVKKLQRVKAGQIPLKQMDLGEVLDEIVNKHARVDGRDITINYSKPAGYIVMANDLLDDIFSNIIGNAIKHSSGPLVINVSLIKVRVDGREYYQTGIEDTGPGFPDELKKKYLHEATCDVDIERRGIGLHLVKALVESFGGGTWIEDRVPGTYSQGCRFVVMLPANVQT